MNVVFQGAILLWTASFASPVLVGRDCGGTEWDQMGGPPTSNSAIVGGHLEVVDIAGLVTQSFTLGQIGSGNKPILTLVYRS